MREHVRAVADLAASFLAPLELQTQSWLSLAACLPTRHNVGAMGVGSEPGVRGPSFNVYRFAATTMCHGTATTWLG